MVNEMNIKNKEVEKMIKLLNRNWFIDFRGFLFEGWNDEVDTIEEYIDLLVDELFYGFIDDLENEGDVLTANIYRDYLKQLKQVQFMMKK